MTFHVCVLPKILIVLLTFERVYQSPQFYAKYEHCINCQNLVASIDVKLCTILMDWVTISIGNCPCYCSVGMNSTNVYKINTMKISILASFLYWIE